MWRITRDTDESPNVLVMKEPGYSSNEGLLKIVKDRMEENKVLTDFFKNLDKQKDKDKDKPKKISVGLSASEIMALMLISAFPIVAISSFVINICVKVIRTNLHEMLQ